MIRIGLELPEDDKRISRREHYNEIVEEKYKKLVSNPGVWFEIGFWANDGFRRIKRGLSSKPGVEIQCRKRKLSTFSTTNVYYARYKE